MKLALAPAIPSHMSEPIGSGIWVLIAGFLLIQAVMWGLIGLRRRWRLRQKLPYAAVLLPFVVMGGLAGQFQTDPVGTPGWIVSVVVRVLILPYMAFIMWWMYRRTWRGRLRDYVKTYGIGRAGGADHQPIRAEQTGNAPVHSADDHPGD